MKKEVREYMRRIGRKGSKKGVEARMAKLTPEQRSAIAKKAAAARWAKKRKSGSNPGSNPHGNG